ncbi:hypothetical protein AI3067V1_0887 [Klebsiella pneumoniae]|nr:hypothetical protein AI3067V1_0887 [Klebsiella pneumoniae]
MTDITELALRLKLEVHRAVSNFNPQMNIKTRDLKELVEALEKAQHRIDELEARMAMAAMDSESWCLPLDYLQGHKDGLEWASQLAEANHPETGDWLYDDPIELANAIRKGPDIPPAQPVADTEPVAWRWRWSDDAEGYWRYTEEQRETRGSVTAQPLYRHAQPAPVVPELRVDWQENEFSAGWNACRAAMLHAGNSPAQSDCFPAQNHVSPEQNGDAPAQSQGWIQVSERMPENDGAYLCWDNRYVTTYAFIFGAWQANQFIAKNITHWMPLPAGPQEVR